MEANPPGEVAECNNDELDSHTVLSTRKALLLLLKRPGLECGPGDTEDTTARRPGLRFPSGWRPI